MKVAYDALREGTGWDLRVGNYNEARHDALDAPAPAVTPTSTWFPDKSVFAVSLDPGTPGSWIEVSWKPIPDGGDYPTDLTQNMPGAYMDPNEYAVMDSWSLCDRFLGLRRTSYGEVDSPELYTLGDAQWLGSRFGDPAVHISRGWWALDPYVPPEEQFPQDYTVKYWPALGSWSAADESRAQTRLRIARHNIEASINSLDEEDERQHEARQAAWVEQIVMANHEQGDYQKKERETRMIYSMQRAKNVQELLLWFAQTERQSEDNYEYWADAWLATRDLIKRVWAPVVANVTPIWGAVSPEWPGATYPPPQSDATAAVDFTLRNSEGVDVAIPIITCDECDLAGIQVVFDLSVAAELEGGNVFDYEVNVEGWAPPGAIGELWVQKVSNDAWVKMDTLQGTDEYSVESAAFDVGPTDPRPFRRCFVITPGSEYVYEANGAYDFPHLILRLKHIHAEFLEMSWFDLVQLVPVHYATGSSEEERATASPADLNLDGTIDQADFDLFSDGLLECGAIADVRRDHVLDAGDVEDFEEAVLIAVE